MITCFIGDEPVSFEDYARNRDQANGAFAHKERFLRSEDRLFLCLATGVISACPS